MSANQTTNKKPRTAITRFRNDAPFQLAPRANARRANLSKTNFEHLKAGLVKQLLGETSNASAHKTLNLAANEAAALAWTTPYPLLVLPALLSEKASEVRQHRLRQEQIRLATLPLISAAE
jgi:hypothetical protein